MASEPRRVLVLGYGNPARLDDGLGREAARRIAARALPDVTVEEDYELQIEHAVLVAEHDAVVFVDAAAAGPDPFTWASVLPAADTGYTTHALTPAGLLAVTRDGLGRAPPAWVLGIRGHALSDFGERLSEAAASNLAAAVEFLDARLRTRSLGVPGSGAGIAADRSVGSQNGA